MKNSYQYLKKLAVSPHNQTRQLVKDNKAPLLGFKVANKTFYFRTAEVKEIIPRPKSTPLARSKPWLEGLLKVQGEIYTSIDLARFLKIRDEAKKNKFAIAINFDEGNYAFCVDNILGITHVAPNAIEKEKDQVQEWIDDSGELYQVISTANLIGSKEFVKASVF